MVRELDVVHLQEKQQSANQTGEDIGTRQDMFIALGGLVALLEPLLAAHIAENAMVVADTEEVVVSRSELQGRGAGVELGGGMGDAVVLVEAMRSLRGDVGVGAGVIKEQRQTR